MDNIGRYKNGMLAWQINEYSNVVDATGSLSVMEYGKEIDFLVKRVFFLRNIASDTVRGLHSHKDLKQILVCLHGKLTIELDTGIEKQSIQLTPDANSLYLDGRVWRTMTNFCEHTVLMVLCDREYRYDEVVRDYDQFKENLEELNSGIF